MIFKVTEFDVIGCAILGEIPPSEGDQKRILSIQQYRAVGSKNLPRMLYCIGLSDGEEDVTFYGITRAELKDLAGSIFALAHTMPPGVSDD